MSRRPVIGYTIELEDPLLGEVEPSLRRPLEWAGALAIVLPRSTPEGDVGEILDLVDGIQLCGGADVDPAHYGDAERHARTEPIDPAQDAFELALTRGALERGMPVLGICRGIQVLAVAGGGRLTQHVADQHEGAQFHQYSWQQLALEPPGEHWHEVEVLAGSAADGWFAGGPRRVNSFHHQAVADPGPRMRVTVNTPDGVVEAIERSDGGGFAAGLQWHNELMWRHDDRFLRPHQALVAAATAAGA